MPAADWVAVKRGISSCTFVDSALCGRNALLSFFCTSEVLPDSGPSAPPPTSQATITRAGTSHRHTLRDGAFGCAPVDSFSATVVIRCPLPRDVSPTDRMTVSTVAERSGPVSCDRRHPGPADTLDGMSAAAAHTAPLTVVRAGFVDYRTAWDEQRRLHAAVADGLAPPTV